MRVLSRVVAYPESTQILWPHLGSAAIMSTRWAIFQMMPVILLGYFQGTTNHSLMATMAPIGLMLLSVLWGGVYHRMQPRRYVWLYWVVGLLPLMGITISGSATGAVVWLIIASIAQAGMVPMGGDIMRGCYSPQLRGRIQAVLMIPSTMVSALVAGGIGRWLDWDEQAFRVYIPIIVGIHVVAMLLLANIASRPLFAERQRAHKPAEPRDRQSVVRRIATLGSALVQDRHFLRFEAFFMCYGAGWMICFALVPLMKESLHLSYGQYANASQVVFQVVLLVTIVPAGILVDRLGPVRTAAIACGWLTFYPILLIFTTGAWTLALATAVYAAGMATINVVWTIGPITLARRAGDAAQYLAIHGSLVGVRAVVFQTLGVGLYELTGSFVAPLVIAAVMMVAGAIGMAYLDRDLRRASQASP